MRDFHMPGRSGVFAMNGICATSSPIAAQAAVAILEDGGNAMDAAITAAVLLGLCEPSSTGIGGDMFALIRPAGGEKITGFNASGRAPAALDAARLRDAGESAIPLRSAHAVTVPGAIDGFCRLAEDWGRKGLAACLAPSIRYAEEGVPVGPRTAFDWKKNAATLQGDGAKHYLDNGAPYALGAVFRAPGQAEILRRVAEQGRAGFYEGEVMEDMVDSLRALGGLHTAEDFAATAADYVNPVSATYRGYELVELPPNGQGVTALLIANILSHFDVASLDPFGAERAHLEAEATKLAYEARDRFVADPAHALTDRMLSTETAKRLAALIDMNRAAPTPPPAAAAVHKDTVYLTTADKDGMVVSMIYSIFHAFGSGLASKKFGVNFQNRGAGFVLTDGHPNELRGGKRPLHTIIPAMIRKDGKLFASYGVMGGQYQSTGHMRVLSNIADFGMDPQEALDAPRAFADPYDGKLHIERGYFPEARAELEKRGHVLLTPDAPIGGAQMIRLHENGVYEGASDPRKDGCAIGC
ncbi:gamma-glutamyltransferase family protein [Pikeienuella piscinae]|uniref:Gamma-glutamyltransferase family protein n=1 Tax=Pikeienuella piscinae TaxID=2748098 RepID=A0A7L5BTP9_9RHOB|nr:gamma-glutamyltransferase family protein [Pikeienuella piscinae]QIE54852.1 gamma-glutamyltransferase family protein [Pikeienuella piscinae]